ncbi:helix-turn-helix domain-containing protein [Streptomyces sp. NPDC054864]
MLGQSAEFGPELRRLRIAAGFTLTRLAASVHYSKGQLSKVETGNKRASIEFARLCDTALGADGALAALVASSPGTKPARPSFSLSEEATVMADDPAAHPGTGARRPLSRRQLMATGAASVLAIRTVGPTDPVPPGSVGDTLLTASLGLLDQYRRIGQVTPPDVLVPALAEQVRSLRSLAARTGARPGLDLLALSSRFAEYTGWLAQEAGDDDAALRWTAHAVDLADGAGDHDLASYAFVRRALITYYRGDAADTIALAEAAHSDRLPPRIRGLAAQRKAQGHALAGDYASCLRSLDEARELLAEESGPTAGSPVLGSTHLADPASMITGWCLLDLGRPRAAAEALDRECARLPEHAWRTQARYGVRRALAHAVAGEIDHACEIAEDVLHLATSVGSATIATDLRRLAHTLARHPRNRSYLAVAPRLTAALSPSPH